MKLHPHDVEKIASLTLEHYNLRAEDFREGTRDHDVSQTIAALLSHIEGEPPFTILDFGCGPGRDLKVFAALGHVAIGLDGAERFAAMARTDTGYDVWQQDFLKLDLPDGRFDGVFANASLFHVPSQELPRPAACCSVPTRAARTRKAGIAAATALTTIFKRGAVSCRAPGSSNSITITGPQACRVSSSRGWPACGAGRYRDRHRFRFRNGNVQPVCRAVTLATCSRRSSTS